MAELPAITTAPAPNRDFIQIYTKLGTKAISLGFWEANLRSQRQHDIDSSTIDTLTTTTPRSQITDVEFYGAPAVLGFVSQPNGKHAVAFLSPAFKLLLPPGNLKTTTANTFPGLAGLTMPTAQNDTLSYLYYMSPSSTPSTAILREYCIEHESATDLATALAPSITSPLAAYYDAAAKTRVVVYIEGTAIREAIVSEQSAPVPFTIVTGAQAFQPDTGLAVVYTRKRTYLYYVGPKNKLTRVSKKPNAVKWDMPIEIINVNQPNVQKGAQLTAVLQKDNIHIFWPLTLDVKGLGHGYDDLSK